MTAEERQKLKAFDAKVRNLVTKYQVMLKENEDLYAELEAKDKQIADAKAEAAKYKKDYETLKLARMIDISDDEMKHARTRITNLVREVNKCINLLTSDNQSAGQ